MKDCFYVVIIIIIYYFIIIIICVSFLFRGCVCVVVLVASGRQDRTRQID